AATEPDKPAERAPALNANAGMVEGDGARRDDLPVVTVGFDRRNHWKRRSVRFIKAHVLSAGSMTQQQDAAEMIRDLTLATLDQPPQQFEREYKEALSVIETSGLDKAAQHRIRTLIDGYTEDLQALRSVPKTKRNERGLSPLIPETAAESQRTMSTLTDTAGGYLVPTPMLAQIFVFVEEYGYARSMFTVMPMTSDTL